jgi:hypothetical protein
VRGAASAAQRLGDRKKTVFSVEIAHNGFVNRFVNQAELVQTLEAFPISAAKRRSGEAAKRRSGEAAKRRSGFFPPPWSFSSSLPHHNIKVI